MHNVRAALDITPLERQAPSGEKSDRCWPRSAGSYLVCGSTRQKAYHQPYLAAVSPLDFLEPEERAASSAALS